MKKQDLQNLLDAIGEVDEELLKRSEDAIVNSAGETGAAGPLSGEKSPNTHGDKKMGKLLQFSRKYGAIAAALVVFVAGGAFVYQNNLSQNASTELATSMNTEMTVAEEIAQDEPLLGGALEEAEETAVTSTFGSPYVIAEVEEEALVGEAYGDENATDKTADKEVSMTGFENFVTDSTRIYLENSTENAVYSPLNVYLALSMLAEVTDGNSRTQILDTLGVESTDELKTLVQTLWKSTVKETEYEKTALANSVWLSDQIDYNYETFETLASEYFASSYAGEMGSKDFDQAFQDWLNENTNNLLENQISNLGFDSETILALASTIYYKAAWADAFAEEGNTEETFHGIDGDTTATFMHAEDSGSTYYRGSNFGAIARYMSDASLSWIILPDEGSSIDDVLASDEWSKLISNPYEWKNQVQYDIAISLPKFDMESQIDLIDGMQEMGITDIFDAETSDFSPITTEVEDIVLSSALHGARMIVNEDGVEAAAYTVMMMKTTALAPDFEQMEFVADRPFLFVVSSRDFNLDLNVPLFVGVVNQVE